MNTNLQAVSSAGYRRANKEEIEQAAMALRSVDGAVAGLIESDHALALGNDLAIVVSDFGAVPEGALVLLVPPGRYCVPSKVLEQVQYIIGLAWKASDYPVLELQAEPTSVTSSDTLEVTDLCVVYTSAGLIGLTLEASRPTVLELFLGGDRQFSDIFFNVHWQENVDGYDQANCRAVNGRDWLIAAYGESMCRRRNVIENGLDAFHRGMMNTIDGVFRPLVRAAEKVDRILGLK
ncbi:hypothetical protein [Azonexus hydrophilus]|uniref:hypothetical protein n=1 Tax=Azonexus hydrophilus TaxID=418702 RepID=UPI00048DE067|nr:hypothetical protein [Azonexus hydrophilus]